MNENTNNKPVLDTDFLMAAERKYPYKINGKISIPLLQSSMDEARLKQDNVVANRAQVIYNEHCE